MDTPSSTFNAFVRSASAARTSGAICVSTSGGDARVAGDAGDAVAVPADALRRAGERLAGARGERRRQREVVHRVDVVADPRQGARHDPGGWELIAPA